MRVEPLYLSPSRIADWERCRWSYLLKHVYRWRETTTGNALIFGGAIDEAVDAHLRGLLQGREVDPTEVFIAAFLQKADEGPVDYGAKWSEESMLAMGIELMKRWPDAWQEMGLTVACDATGEPLMQREVAFALPGNVIVRGRIDLGVFTREGEFAVVDNKTAAQPYPETALMLNEQLTTYQIGMDIAAEQWGLPKPGRLGLIEMIKRQVPKRTGQGPTVEPLVLTARRSEQQVKEYLQKILWIAEDIRGQRFMKNPRMAFESPCAMCSMARACTAGDYTDVDFSKARYVPAEVLQACKSPAAA